MQKTMSSEQQKTAAVSPPPDDIDNEPSDDDDDTVGDSPSLCTFAATGENPTFQAIFVCLDCTESEGTCICRACAELCHAGHDVDYIAMGPAYCDCQKLANCCRIKEASEEEAVRISVPPGGMKNHVAPPLSEGTFVQEAFSISSLDDYACDRLVKEVMELVKHSRDTHWIELNSKAEEKLSKLEDLALTILRHHVNEYQLCDDGGNFCGGAEWWVQVKPVTLPENSNDSRLVHAGEGEEAVDLHYDKDEALAESFDLGSFPTLSTVTYLTETPSASPTIAFSHKYDNESDVMDEMLVSYPRRTKHIVFDGRLLHGAPAHHALRTMKDAVTEKDSGQLNRVTFLVNVWVDRQPSGVKALPSNIRQLLRAAGKRKKLPSIRQNHQQIVVKFERIPIEVVDIEKEDDLPESVRGRIELPFVSKGATWISRVRGSDLVVVTFPPPATEQDTFRVRFGPGLQAYLEYQSEDSGYDDGSPVARAQESVEYI